MARYRPKEGHIQLWRRLQDHEYYPSEEDRPFTRMEAWIDLLYSAAFKAHTRYFKGRKVKLQQGELVTSERDLSKRWQWSRTKLRTFLEHAVKNKQIDHWTNQGVTFIRVRRLAGLVDYDVERKTRSRTSKKTPIEVPPSSTPPVIVRRAVASDSKPERIGGYVDNFMKKLRKR